MKFQSGFTLIELVAVIVLVGILSVYAASKFSSRQGFSEYAIRDQIIAGARIAQQRAMYDHSPGACYRLSINSGVISAQRFNGSSYDNIGPTQDWINGIAISDVTVTDNDGDGLVYFNGLGSPLDNTPNCGGAVSQASLNIVGESTLGVLIYETGYIQALP